LGAKKGKEEGLLDLTRGGVSKTAASLIRNDFPQR